MLTQANTRKQGDVGTAFAICYFARSGYTINVPLSDSQPYDLIVDKDGALQRVQVKTSTKHNVSGAFRVEMRTISNTRGHKLDIRKFSAKNVELVFVVTETGRMYLIPSPVLDGKGGMTLNADYDPYLVT